MSEFEIRVEEKPEGVTLHLSGDLDMAVSPLLRDRLREVFETKPSRIFVRMKEVTMMDSSGIAVLIEALRFTRKRRMELALTAPSGPVRKVLQMARLDDGVFEILDDEP